MRKTVVILVLILLFLSFGCSSLSTWVRSNLEGVPIWVYEPQVARGQSAFVGSGSADTEIRARILAYESVLAQISTYIGEDVTGTYIVQLSSRGAVEEFRLRVTQEFVKTEEGVIQVWFLAVADREVLETARTEVEIQLLQQQEKMERLFADGTRYYRENKDLLAVQAYLDIAVIAHSLPVDRGEQRLSDAIDRIRTILEPLRLTVSSVSSEVPSTVVSLRRGSKGISPRVIQAPVIARSSARNGMGELYEDTQRFMTDQEGQFSYRNLNPTLVGAGTIVFEIGLRDRLKPLQEIDEELYVELTRLIESKQVGYPYRRSTRIGSQPLVIAVQEYSLQGQLLDTSAAGLTIARTLAKDGLGTRVASLRADEEDDVNLLLLSAFPDSMFALTGDVGVSHMKVNERSATVSVTGEISLINLTDGNSSGTTGSVTAQGFGSSLEEAQGVAFTRFGTIATSLMYRYLYR